MMEYRERLGKNGLTMTSANHIANMAKESYESLEARLASLRFVNRDYTLVVNGQTYRVENESDKSELSAVIPLLKEVSSLKALIAWLRECIKAKEQLLEKGWDARMKALQENGELMKEPEAEDPTNFNEVLACKSIDVQERYYALEAKCATFGKCIHEKGPFAVARDTYYEKKKNPTTIVGAGQEAEVNNYTSSFESKEIDDTFFSIQNSYRSVQAELNKMKSDIDAEVDSVNKERYKAYQQAFEKYSTDCKVKEIEYQQEIKALKIIVPESLKEICAKVSALSKAKEE